MRNLKDEIKNRINKLPKEEQTVSSLIRELQEVDSSIGKSICDCLNAKENALKGNKDELRMYLNYATQRLQESMEMTDLFRVMLGKIIHGLITVDKEAIKHGNTPITPFIMEGRVELK